MPRQPTRRFVTLTALLLLCIGCSHQNQTEIRRVDITYSSRGVEVPATLVTPALTGPVPLVLLIHGHGGSRHEAGGYTQVAEGLAARGIASIRMDFPGCGDSTESFAHNNLTNMLADIEAAKAYALAHANIDTARIGLLGFSMGGRLAIGHAHANPGYNVMALWAPAAQNGADTMVEFVGGPVKWAHMKGTAQIEGAVPFTTSWGMDQTLGYQWFTDLEFSTPAYDIASFDGALLVLYGDRDDVVPPVVSDGALRAAVNASPAVRHVVQGADHGLGLFTDEPALTEDAVQTTVSFLAEHL